MKEDTGEKKEGVVCGYCCHHCPDKNCYGWKPDCIALHEEGGAECQRGDQDN